MVENNENIEEAPRKRKGLFGARKSRVASEAAPDTGDIDSGMTDSGGSRAASAPGPFAGANLFAESDASGAGFSAPEAEKPVALRPTTSLLFQAPDLPVYSQRAPSRGDGRAENRDDRSERDSRSNRDDRSDRDSRQERTERDNRDDRDDDRSGSERDEDSPTVRRRSRRRSGEEDRDTGGANPANTVVKVRAPRAAPELSTEPQRIKGSTRLEAKKQRRRDGRDAGRRRPVITEAEFLARRESVDRTMVVRSKYGRIQIGVLEDGVLAEHYVAKAAEASLIGNVYLGRVQNVLPSMEAAFVDIGRGRNAVLYSGEVDWEAAAAENSNGHQARRIELALKPGDKVLVQVTKDPVGHKGARLTSQVSLPGRYLVYVPNGSMNGISRKLPDTERARLKKVLKEVLPENVGVIVRTAAEGATDEQLTLDVNRLTAQWGSISETIETVQAPALLHSEPDLLVKIVRDVFNEDFHTLVIEGVDARETISGYLSQVAPDLIDRIESYESDVDSFDHYRISEQIEKALDRKVWLPSGGSLVIDRTEAMTVVDVNTGKFVGSGGNLEETVTKNNLEAAEEIVRQLRLRDIGGIIVVDFIDMVLETNRDLVLRRLVECLSRDRTKHQVAEVTSLGLVQMTRKKLGLGLLESFSENCEVCAGRGVIVRHDPTTKHRQSPQPEVGRRARKGGNDSSGNTNGNGPASGNSGGNGNSNGNGNTRSGSTGQAAAAPQKAGNGTHAITDDVRNALAQIATSTIAAQSADVIEGATAVETAGETAVPVIRAARTRVVAPVTELSPVELPTPEVAAGEVAKRGVPKTDQPKRSRSQGGVSAVSASSTEAADSGRDNRPEAASIDPASAGSAQAGPGNPSPGTDAAGNTGPDAIVLDLPVHQQPKATKRISPSDAEQILGSVLDALPEPRQPGQGRTRTSRRASSAGTVTTSTPGSSL